jgi:hypothetical protein
MEINRLPLDINRKIIGEHIEEYSAFRKYLCTISTKEEAKMLYDEFIAKFTIGKGKKEFAFRTNDNYVEFSKYIKNDLEMMVYRELDEIPFYPNVNEISIMSTHPKFQYYCHYRFIETIYLHLDNNVDVKQFLETFPNLKTLIIGDYKNIFKILDLPNKIKTIKIYDTITDWQMFCKYPNIKFIVTLPNKHDDDIPSNDNMLFRIFINTKDLLSFEPGNKKIVKINLYVHDKFSFSGDLARKFPHLKSIKLIFTNLFYNVHIADSQHLETIHITNFGTKAMQRTHKLKIENVPFIMYIHNAIKFKITYNSKNTSVLGIINY